MHRSVTGRMLLGSGRHLSAVCGAALLVSTSLWAQDVGVVMGRVTERVSGAPINGVLISIDGAPRAQTGLDGRYRVTGVTPGTRRIELRRISYTTTGRAIDVTAGDTVIADFALEGGLSVLGAVTVIGTRTDLDETRERITEIPGAVALIEPAEIRATRQANLKDVLGFTPGVYVQPRFGAADESQISIRGSGLRNNFHARGVNLLVNGMPYRNADGFTDFESLELLTTEAIAVYKGANALRYGGSTLGGAINLDTKTGHTAEPISAFAQFGSYGFAKAQLSSGRAFDAFDYYASYARTELDNYRDWSDQRRDRVNVHAGYRLGEQLDARGFYFFARVREHLPGSLTRAEFDADPEQAVAINVDDRWGRDYDLHHLGVQFRAQLTPTQRLEVSPYTQYRDIDHPIFEVIAQISRDYGAEIRYENTSPLAGRENRLTVGVQPAYQNMDNRQFENEGGEHGALTRDEKDEVRNLGVYAENALSIGERLTVLAGARYDYSRRSVDDFYPGNGDQSAERVFDPISPRVGMRWEIPSIGGSVFANASHTVEPPLLLELSSFGNAGGFIDLAAQRAWQYEVGVRGQRLSLAWELSLYDIELRDEILNINVQPFPGAPFTVPSYRNADRTRHAGLEAGVAWRPQQALFVRGDVGDRVTARLAYTFTDFAYVDDPTFDGNDLPGAPRHHVAAQLQYEHPAGLSIAPSVEWVPAAYFVNSENTVRNDAWVTLAMRAEWRIARAGVSAFVEGRNLLNERYSASVQVDNAAGRFYEPADRRTVYAGFRVAP